MDNSPTEHDEQCAVVDWFESVACEKWPWLVLPDGRPGIAAIANGGYRHPGTARKLQAEGVSAGIPDLVIPALHLWIEMKRRRNAHTSPEQRAWAAHLAGIPGVRTVTCAGSDRAIEEITATATLLEEKRNNAPLHQR